MIAPGPRGLSLFSTALPYTRDPFGTVERMQRDYGDVVGCRSFGQQVFQLTDPEHVEHVLLRNRNNYVKDPFTRRLRQVVGEGLLTSEGATWKEHRRQMAAAFTPKRTAAYGPTFVACTREALERWRPDQRLDLGEAMTQITLEIAVRTLFGTSAGDACAARVGAAFSAVNAYYARLVGNLPLWVPTQRNLALKRARAELNAVVEEILETRRASDERGPDLLSALLQARDAKGERMSDAHLRDQVMTLLLAGHETTALTLTYALQLIGSHPAVEAQLLDELALLGEREPTADDLLRLPYLANVVSEALRLYPPAAILAREAVSADQIGGYAIPAKSVVTIPTWAIHRDPRWFEAPKCFDPARWTDALRARLPRFAYLPFGGGQRRCIGEAFALLEARLVLATLLQRYRFEVAEPGPIATTAGITMRPTHAVRVRLLERSPLAAALAC